MDKYGASVFMVTFAVNFLLLRAAAQGERSTHARIRAAAGAAIGAGYAVFVLRSGNTYMLLPVLLMMGAATYGFRKKNVGKWGRFLFLWLVANAMAVGVTDGNGWFLTLAAALLCLLALMGRDGGTGREVIPITIGYGEQTVRLRALRDNGNLLTDPVSGESVLIVPPWVGSKLLGLSSHDLRCPVETVESGKVMGLRLIPYSAVGQSAGLLLGMRLRDVTVDGKRCSRIVAFSPNPIGDGTRFEALAGGAV